MSGFLSSSLSRKYAMSLSAFFLIFFLLMHVTINLLSIFSKDAFNTASHFMGTNPLIQFVMQPILIIGVIFHFVMGFVLEYKNSKARSVKYHSNKGSANSTWMSRNMLISGLVILGFLVFHFNDFWVPEIVDKFIKGNDQTGKDYLHHVKVMFENPFRVGVYIISFVLLALHLLHGFQSAFQSIGLNNKYIRAIKKFTTVYSIVIPLLFIIIALFHHFNH